MSVINKPNSSFKSHAICSNKFLSVFTPNALNNTNIGIGFLKLVLSNSKLLSLYTYLTKLDITTL